MPTDTLRNYFKKPKLKMKAIIHENDFQNYLGCCRFQHRNKKKYFGLSIYDKVEETSIWNQDIFLQEIRNPVSFFLAPLQIKKKILQKITHNFKYITDK